MVSPDKRGNRALIGICSMNIVLYILTYFFYRTINKRREAIWQAWTEKVSLTNGWLMDLYLFRAGAAGVRGNNK